MENSLVTDCGFLHGKLFLPEGKADQPSKDTCMLGHLWQAPDLRAQTAREQAQGSTPRCSLGCLSPASHAARWAHESIMGSWRSEPTLSMRTLLPCHWNSWWWLCFCTWLCQNLFDNAVHLAPRISACQALRREITARGSRGFSAERHSHSWLLQEPECGQQEALPVEHVAQTL